MQEGLFANAVGLGVFLEQQCRASDGTKITYIFNSAFISIEEAEVYAWKNTEGAALFLEKAMIL